MDISDIMSKFRLDNDETVESTDKPWAPKHGPQSLRLLTNGQIRRAQDRAQKSRRRKTTSRYRRGWMANQLQIAYLRGNLQAVGLVAYHGHRKVDPESASFKTATKTLEDKYGSVAEALTKYNDIMLERAQQAAQ